MAFPPQTPYVKYIMADGTERDARVRSVWPNGDGLNRISLAVEVNGSEDAGNFVGHPFEPAKFPPTPADDRCVIFIGGVPMGTQPGHWH